MKKESVNDYISKDEKVVKELYCPNGTFCVFTDKKVYRGLLSENNKNIALYVDDLHIIKNVEYKKEYISGSGLSIAVIFLMLFAVMTVIGLVSMGHLSENSSRTIASVAFVLSGVFLLISLIAFGTRTRPSNETLLVINFSYFSFCVDADSFTPEEVNEIITTIFNLKQSVKL